MEVADHVDVDDEELARSSPAVADLLCRLNEATSALALLFSQLASDPSQFGARRSEVERLDAERAILLQQLGEHAARVFVVCEATDLQGTPAPASSATADTLETNGVSPPPVSQNGTQPEMVAPATRSSPGDVVAFRTTYRADPAPPPSAPADKGTLLSLAHFVDISLAAVSDERLGEEIDSLDRATAPSRETQWRKMLPRAQVQWLSILVAWAKALEEESRATGLPSGRVSEAFARLRAYSIATNPGFIHGFARAAEPTAATWRATAFELLERLNPKAERVVAKKPISPERDDEDEEADEEDRHAKVPEDWPYFENVRGCNAVMFGGTVKEQSRIALERAFQFANLEWVPHERPRLLQSLSERAARGSVDLILVNKFVAHKDTMVLERVSTVPIILVRWGYGVTAVRTALEEHLSRSPRTGE